MKLAFSLMDYVFVCFKGVPFWVNLTTKVAGSHALSSRGKSPAPRALSDNPDFMCRQQLVSTHFNLQYITADSG